MNQEIEKLLEEREKSDAPHLANEKIQQIEMEAGLERLQSYPSYMAINHITACNARCRFCYYYPQAAKMPLLRLSDFEKMEWLKYVSTIDLFGGLGEPLMNPDFCDIAELLRSRNRTQFLNFTTNGQLLAEDVSRRLAGVVDAINISINAATKDTYEYLMPRCSWDRLMENIRTFQKINMSRSKPTRLTFSCVLNRHNIEEAHKLASLAADFNIDNPIAGFIHFATTGIWPDRPVSDGVDNCSRLLFTDSLYYDKKLYDDHFFEILDEFKKHDIVMSLPPKFNESVKICFGERVQTNIEVQFECCAPWILCFVNPFTADAWLSGTQEDERWCSVCCSPTANYSSLVRFDYENFLDNVWNSDVFALIRRYVNSEKDCLKGCAYCRITDKSDRTNNKKYLETMRIATMEIYGRLGISCPDHVEKKLRIISEHESKMA